MFVRSLFFLGFFVCCLSAPSPIIQTEAGQVQGMNEVYRSISINSYIGLPYAQPPLGSLRFRPTQPHPPWSGVRNVTQFSPICPQTPSDAFTFPPNYVIDEDCLTLNVWAPANTTSGKRAVMVWIHGGGFQNGGNVEMRERGGDLAALGDVVVVVINYRLGILGFLAIPPMFQESKEIGNWGLKDQVFALQWVQRNIANFGGDPKRVTIFGESAGGSAMGMHLAMPASYPLFSKAIVESGSPFIELLSLNISLTLGIATTVEAGCFNRSDVLECMRAHPWKKLLREEPPDIFPTIDGLFLPLNPYEAFTQGAFARVPIMVGDVSGEFWQAIGAVFPLGPLNISEYHSLVHFFVGPKFAAEVLALYPCEAFNATDCRAVLGEMFSDFVLSCPTSLTGEFFANASLPVYAFEFTRRASWIHTPARQDFQTGAPHASEIEFVWSTTSIHNSTQQERNLAVGMSQYWTNFAKYGNPSANSSMLQWPAYKSPDYSRIRFDLSSSVKDGYNELQCEFWRPIYAFYANFSGFPFPAESPLSNRALWRK